MTGLEYAAANRDYILHWRRHFHAYPELGFQERETSAKIKEELDRLDIPWEAVGKTGIVASVGQGRPVIGIRADMDALPIEEKSQADYCSRFPGVMHACGHDGHMAALMGVCRYLSEHRDGLNKTVRLIFQPAEELVGGAEAMLKERPQLFEDLDCIIGIHLWSLLPAGSFNCEPGARMAAVDFFDITITGKSCHGSTPHMGIDAVVVGAEIVAALQAVVSRQVNPLSSGVLSIGTFHSGTASNIIANQARLGGTVRYFDKETGDTLKSGVEKVVAGIAEAFGAGWDIHYRRITPVLENQSEITAFSASVLQNTFGEGSLVPMDKTTGGEDFAIFLKKVPGSFVFVGAGYEGAYPHHHERFDIDEEAVINASAYFIEFVNSYGK